MLSQLPKTADPALLVGTETADEQIPNEKEREEGDECDGERDRPLSNRILIEDAIEELNRAHVVVERSSRALA